MNKSMKWFLLVSELCKIFSLGLLAYNFQNLKLFLLLLILIGLLFVWISVKWHKKFWISNLVFVICSILVGCSLWLGTPIYRLIPVVVLSLIAWDIDDFFRRISSNRNSIEINQILNKHLIILSLATSIGTFTAIISLVIHFQLSFEISLALSILGVLGLLLGLRSNLEML